MKKLLIVAAAAALALSFTGESAATKTVGVGDNFYSRSSITIKKNDKVKFDWRDTANRHNVKGNGFKSKTTSSSSYSYTRKFSSTGSFSLHCTRHPDDMKIKVKVKS